MGLVVPRQQLGVSSLGMLEGDLYQGRAFILLHLGWRMVDSYRCSSLALPIADSR